MSIHKLTAGSGYDYLTRQVAAQDATERGHTGLASYYAERGETPGQWIGSGIAGIDGLAAGDVVTAEQMQALFGSGHHPLAAQRREQLQGPGLSDRDYQGVTRLGVPFKVFSGDVSAFRLEVSRRIAGVNEAAGLPGDWPVRADQRAKVRTEVAREFFVAEHGRQPEDARELAGLIARHSRPKTQAVAGFDLTFSPVKSVSTLWAIADPQVAARIELAHQGAVKDALAFIEAHALFTREGTNGVRQVDVQGMVATAFTHRDSRTGDPDLHTHVAVANKVQSRDGRWLSIDGRVLFKANVPASETYNTSLERRLRVGLGLRFAERANPDPRKRPVREVVGVDPALNQRWSARRAAILVRHSELAADFQAAHGRPPTPVESLKLAQQATLETREAKHEPRTLAEQRATWQAQAVEVLGGRRNVAAMISRALSPKVAPAATVDAAWVADASARVLEAMEARRSTWQIWHVRAEAQRQVRGAEVPTGQVERVVGLIVGEVLDSLSVSGPARAGHRRTRAAASLGRFQRLRRLRRRVVHLGAGTAGRATPGGHGRTARGARSGGLCGRHGPAGKRRQRGHPQRRSGSTGAHDGHLRCPPAAGDRARRCRQDHGDARPGRCVDRGRRHRRGSGPIGGCRSGAADADRCKHRHPGQAHLVVEKR